MIDIIFINDWSNKYKYKASKPDSDLYQKINMELNKLFPSGKVEYITKNILCDIVDWKAPRAKNRVFDNREEFVKEVTKHCFSSENEQFKIEGLTILNGVGYRVATAILHFCFPLEYTVMDFRAWWTLQQRNYLPEDYTIKDDFEHWQKYLKVCREIHKKCGCSLRELDKALWQYSKEKQNI